MVQVPSLGARRQGRRGRAGALGGLTLGRSRSLTLSLSLSLSLTLTLTLSLTLTRPEALLEFLAASGARTARLVPADMLRLSTDAVTR